MKAAVDRGVSLEDHEFKCWRCVKKVDKEEQVEARRMAREQKRAEKEEREEAKRAVDEAFVPEPIHRHHDSLDGIWEATKLAWASITMEQVRRCYESKFEIMKLIIEYGGRNDYKMSHWRNAHAGPPELDDAG